MYSFHVDPLFNPWNFKFLCKGHIELLYEISLNYYCLLGLFIQRTSPPGGVGTSLALETIIEHSSAEIRPFRFFNFFLWLSALFVRGWISPLVLMLFVSIKKWSREQRSCVLQRRRWFIGGTHGTGSRVMGGKH